MSLIFTSLPVGCGIRLFSVFVVMFSLTFARATSLRCSPRSVPQLRCTTGSSRRSFINGFSKSTTSGDYCVAAINRRQQRLFSVNIPSSVSVEETVINSSSGDSVVFAPPLKLMIFVDGTWLYYSMVQGRGGHRNCPIQRKLGDNWKMTHEFDWQRLPQLIEANIASQMKQLLGKERSIDLRRISVFTSLREDTHKDSTREKLFEDLQHLNFDVHRFVTTTEQEKCVDIALAVEMLYMATVYDAYDIAVVVTGDKDFMPAMQKTRLLAKRVAICSLRNSCNQDLADPNAQIRDFDIIWMDDYISELVVPKAEYEDTSATDDIIAKEIAQLLASSATGFITSRDLGRELQSRKNDQLNRMSMLQAVKKNHAQLRAFIERYDRFFAISNNDLIVVPDFLVSLQPGIDADKVDVFADNHIRDIRSGVVDPHRPLISSLRGTQLFETDDFQIGDLEQGVTSINNNAKTTLCSLTKQLIELNGGSIDSRNIGRALKMIPIYGESTNSARVDALSFMKSAFGSLSGFLRLSGDMFVRTNLATVQNKELFLITLRGHGENSDGNYSSDGGGSDSGGRSMYSYNGYSSGSIGQSNGYSRNVNSSGNGGNSQSSSYAPAASTSMFTTNLQHRSQEIKNKHSEYSQMKLSELKDKLRVQGLPVSGNKEELIRRILVANLKAEAGG